MNDGSLTTAVATVTTADPLNDAPMAFEQSLTNGEDTAVAITLTGSDVDGPVTNFSVVAARPTGR